MDHYQATQAVAELIESAKTSLKVAKRIADAVGVSFYIGDIASEVDAEEGSQEWYSSSYNC